ncbi:hypothetical protein DIPPA_10240 [Diplonema papillatum]|nr:hypothetical protein DIPPA_10240 [Diplonema papillatum]|eukprot:gene4091-6359_t
MPEGTVKHWGGEKGFGFITCAQSDVFFHRTAVRGPLSDVRAGARVWFDAAVDASGRSTAKNVRFTLDAAPQQQQQQQQQHRPGGRKKSLFFEPPAKVSGVAVFLLCDQPFDSCEPSPTRGSTASLDASQADTAKATIQRETDPNSNEQHGPATPDETRKVKSVKPAGLSVGFGLSLEDEESEEDDAGAVPPKLPPFLAKCRVLLGHLPKKGGWESSGYYVELSERCDFVADTQPVSLAMTSLTGDTPSSRAVAKLEAALGAGGAVRMRECRHISVFHPGKKSCFQSIYVMLPPDAARRVAAPCAGAPYDSFKWIPVGAVTGKTTCEKILQHTEQRVHFLTTSRKVQAALGLQ